MLILPAEADEAMVGTATDRISTVVAKHSGQVHNTGRWGRRRFAYEIDDVRLDQRVLTDALNATSDELWLQTSEGPKGTPGKTQLRAIPIGLPLPADHAAANPVAKPVNCG